ncbi:MAG: hypothetical protein E7360_06450 [Clostridiales bacterium]|nr:hypothetical protein [Clostridiales bacterium]
MKKAIKIILFFVTVILTFVLGFTAYFFVVTKDLKFDEGKLTSSTEVCSIYYADGNKIEFCKNDEYARIDDIPLHVRNAVIAIEDKRFYSHNGIDLKSILRAVKNNAVSGKFKEGASTISQQLVKNTFLSGEKTLNRKLKEIKLAMILERKLTKDEILEKYLNTVYFGENSYGIISASNNYFGKKVNDLTVEEGALLAALLKAPTYYNPFKNYEKAKSRRDLVLDEMNKQNMLSAENLKTCKNKEINLNFNRNYDLNNHLVDEVLSEAIEVLKLNKTADLTGYKIYTKLDKSLLFALPNVNDYGVNTDYSIIVTDNSTKQIVAYYSSVGEIKRNPASSAKPWLIYAPAIEENLINEATKILDEKTNFNGYEPENYGDKYYGYVSCKTALSKSLNVPSVKICNALGFDKIKSYAKKMGVEYTNEDLSIALGNLSNGLTLKEIADLYSVFTNEGTYNTSRFITEIQDHKGKTVFKNKGVGKKIFSTETAFIINDILKDCAKIGTAKKLQNLPYSVCAKTGTNGNTNGNKDAYCIAYTTEHTVAVWMGNKDGSLMPNSISGGNFPTAIAKDVFETIYTDYSPKDFAIPNSVVKVSIDKTLYEKDAKIYQNLEGEKNGLDFFFKKGFEPKAYENNETSVFIKTYKITCNKRNIELYCERENGVEYLIFDSYGNQIFDSYKSGDFKYYAKSDGEYQFFLTPYKVINGKIIYGEKIKLPSVLAEGKKEILDTPWWED